MCILRQHIPCMPLQQGMSHPSSEANARNGMVCASRNVTSAIANQRAERKDIKPSIRSSQAKPSALNTVGERKREHSLKPCNH